MPKHLFYPPIIGGKLRGEVRQAVFKRAVSIRKAEYIRFICKIDGQLAGLLWG